MLELNNLKFAAIGRYEDEQFIDFDKLDTLNQIDGAFPQSGGSSGAGKSTILHALEYLLGICKRPTTKLQCRFTKKKIMAEGNFTYFGRPLIIHRGSNGLIIKGFNKDGTELSVSGSSPEAEEKLAEIMGVAKKIFSELIHKKQKQRGYFLNLTAGGKFDLMLKVLGLESWKDKLETAAKTKSTIEKELAEVDAKISPKRVLAEQRRKDIESIIVPENPNNAVFIEQLQNELDNLELKKSNAKLELEKKMGALVKPVKQDKQFDYTNINEQKNKIAAKMGELGTLEREHNLARQALTQKKSELDTKNYSLKSLASENERNKAEILKVRGEMKHLEDKTCPKCLQKWNDGTAETEIAKLKDKFTKLKGDIEIALEKLKQAPVVAEDLVKVVKEIEEFNKLKPSATLEAEISELKVKLAQDEAFARSATEDTEYLLKLTTYQTSQLEIENKSKEVAEFFNSKINPKRAELQAEKGKLDSYNNAVVSQVKSLKSFNEDIEKYEKEAADLEASKAEVNERLEVVEESIRVIKSFLNQKFQESLETVANMATDILANVSNTRNSSIYFEAFKTKKDGSISEEVTALVSLEGEEGVPLDTLSGGEETAYELAVDLAFNEMVESVSNMGFNLYFMDEPFDGMDEVGVEGLVEMLKGFRTKKKLVIVSHSPAIKEMATKTILVERDGNKSKIKSIS